MIIIYKKPFYLTFLSFPAIVWKNISIRKSLMVKSFMNFNACEHKGLKISIKVSQ